MLNIRRIFKSDLYSNLLNEESGAVIIIVTVAMVAFLSVLALTLDVGMAYIDTDSIQKAADAAVISAGRLLPVNQYDTYAINRIKNSAINYANQNGFSGLTQDNVVLGSLSHNLYTDIQVTVTKQEPLNFARLFGINNITLTRRATAKLSPVTRTTGLAPLGVLKEEIDEHIANNNLTHVVLKYGTRGGTQSSFGALDLSGHGGGSDYRLWLAHGYAGEITVSDILLEEGGAMVGPTYQGFQTRYDACTHFGAHAEGEGCTINHYDPACPRIIKVAVYTPNPDGNVVVCGFAAFLLESQTQDGYITGSFLHTITTGSTSGDSVGTDPNTDFGLYNLVLSK